MSDQATDFTGQVISELCDLLGITKIRMLPYYPQTNGTVERVHQILKRMIAKLDPDKRAKWPSHLGPMLIPYNATRSLITGYLTYFLMFRCQPRLLVDLFFLTVRQEKKIQRLLMSMLRPSTISWSQLWHWWGIQLYWRPRGKSGIMTARLGQWNYIQETMC